MPELIYGILPEHVIAAVGGAFFLLGAYASVEEYRQRKKREREAETRMHLRLDELERENASLKSELADVLGDQGGRTEQ